MLLREGEGGVEVAGRPAHALGASSVFTASFVVRGREGVLCRAAPMGL
jgi:hypothetical protein